MSSFAKSYVGRSLDNLNKSPKTRPISRVTIQVTDEVSFTAGDDSGETMTVSIPWGTRLMAESLLKQFRGYQYQPYAAEGGRLNPASELGDGVNAGRTYGGLYREELSFGRTMRSDFGAPIEEQAEHELPHIPRRDREVNRREKAFQSTLKVHAGLIAAKVEAEGGDRKSFGWELEADHHSWFADGVEVVRFEKNNFLFEGTIKANAGLIGGLTIEDGFLHTGSVTDYHNVGPGEIYIGPTGINLGGKCMINNRGEIYAESGTFQGSVRAGAIEYGGNNGYFSGGGLTASSVTGGQYGKISGGTITTTNTAGGINTSLGYANYSNDVFSGVSEPANLYATTVKAQSNFYFRGKQAGIKTINGIDVLALL